MNALPYRFVLNYSEVLIYMYLAFNEILALKFAIFPALWTLIARFSQQRFQFK